jgi:hypothetical protein
MGILLNIEKQITEFWTNFFRAILFFLNKEYQSLCVSFLHYIIFIAGFYYLFFVSQPGDSFRVIFFLFLVLATLSYFTFNKCFFTLIELNLCSQQNSIQKFIDIWFGKQVEGNLSSKIVLVSSSIIVGLILLKDYNYFLFSHDRDA